MLSAVLNSDIAMQVSIHVMTAFVELRIMSDEDVMEKFTLYHGISNWTVKYILFLFCIVSTFSHLEIMHFYNHINGFTKQKIVI